MYESRPPGGSGLGLALIRACTRRSARRTTARLFTCSFVHLNTCPGVYAPTQSAQLRAA